MFLDVYVVIDQRMERVEGYHRHQLTCDEQGEGSCSEGLHLSFVIDDGTEAKPGVCGQMAWGMQ